MKKFYITGLMTMFVSQGFAATGKINFENLIQNIDKKMSESAQLLELDEKKERKLDSIKSKINEVKLNQILENILNDIDKSIIYAVNDVCVPVGSNETPLKTRSTELKKRLAIFKSEIGKFLAKIVKDLTHEEQESLPLFYFAVLDRRAGHQLDLIDKICRGNICA